MEKVVFVVELVVVVDVVVASVVLVVASVVAVVSVVDDEVAAVVVVVASVVVVVGGHGFGSHVPLPAAMPPSCAHITESTSVHVSKAPIADDCTQHWIVSLGHGGQTLGPSSTVPPLAAHAAADGWTCGRMPGVQPFPGCSHTPALGLQMTAPSFRPHVERAAQRMALPRQFVGTFSFTARTTQRT